MYGQSQVGYPRLLQGPMVGTVTQTEAHLWMRANEAWLVHVEYDTVYPFKNPVRSETVQVTPDDRFIARLHLKELEPDTVYYYRIFVRGELERLTRDLPAPSFKTAPAAAAKFRIAFGSCVEFMRYREQPVWNAILRSNPDLFFWLGDNIYGDTLEPETLFEEYMRQREVASYQHLLHRVPQLAIWDDHDYGLNNHNRNNPIKEGALEMFKAVWANPSYGLPETPGVFFHYNYGGVDFFFLDNRYYADPQTDPDGPNRTLLGERQLAWLKAGLLNSKAPFKVLISGSGWSIAKGPGLDSFANRLHERNALFQFITDNAIEGVLLVSGDTHLGELNCIPWSERGGYDLYEFVSSALAAPIYLRYALDEAEIRIRPPHIAINYGVLDFDLTQNPATVRFVIKNEQGRYGWYGREFSLTTDDLRNGRTTWREHIDRAILRTMKQTENILSGQP